MKNIEEIINHLRQRSIDTTILSDGFTVHLFRPTGTDINLTSEDMELINQLGRINNISMADRTNSMWIGIKTNL